MLCFPHAKINIGLNVTGKRPDGFHNIESIFYPVPVKDALEAIPSSKLKFESSGGQLSPDPEANTIMQAYELLKQYRSLEPVHFYIYKNIPQGAGLGGGSADGTFALRLLNDLLELDVSQIELHRISQEIGSDCPFFLDSRPKKVTGRGEVLEPVSLDLSEYHYVVVYPGIEVSTKEAYQHITPQTPSVPLGQKVQRSVEDWHKEIHNDFEDYVLAAHPAIKRIKDELYQQGALFASLTGSGSAVYGIFKEATDLKMQFPGNYRVFEGPLP